MFGVMKIYMESGRHAGYGYVACACALKLMCMQTIFLVFSHLGIEIVYFRKEPWNALLKAHSFNKFTFTDKLNKNTKFYFLKSMFRSHRYDLGGAGWKAFKSSFQLPRKFFEVIIIAKILIFEVKILLCQELMGLPL